MRNCAARSDGRTPSGPGYWNTVRYASSKSAKPRSWSLVSMWRRTASQGTRSRAPISGGPTAGSPLVVKSLDEVGSIMYCQVTLLHRPVRRRMATSTREEIQVGDLLIRFLIEGAESRGSVSAFEFDVPAGAKVPVAHSHDGYDETVYGVDGVLTWTV